jgi:PAS domain S-box-containing protein
MLFNNEAYRLLVENHPEVVLIMDTSNGQIMHANQAAVDFYGYSLNEFKAIRMSSLNSSSGEEIREDFKTVRENNSQDFLWDTKKS